MRRRSFALLICVNALMSASPSFVARKSDPGASQPYHSHIDHSPSTSARHGSEKQMFGAE
jgi:hypothetical protein